MNEYGKIEKDILKLKEKVAEITEKNLKFTEYMKAKQQLELGEMKTMSKTYSGGFGSPFLERVESL